MLLLFAVLQFARRPGRMEREQRRAAAAGARPQER